MTYRYPTLSDEKALTLIPVLEGLPIEELAKKAALVTEGTGHYGTGENVPRQHLGALRSRILAIASENGYPSRGTDKQKITFDHQVAIALFETLEISISTASNNYVWQFMTCILMPDIARWRFMQVETGKITSGERFRGGGRNVFKRLWWRACLFRNEHKKDDPWDLLKSLGEEESVQFMERPTLAGHLGLLTTSIQRYLEFIRKNDRINKQDLLRDLQKRIRRLTPLIEFEALTREEIAVILDDQLAKAAKQVAPNESGKNQGKATPRKQRNRRRKNRR